MANIDYITGPKEGELFTAATFLEYMRKSAPHWWDNTQDKTLCPWVFRGQWNADFMLLPTAARSDFAGVDDFKNLVEKINLELDEYCAYWEKYSPNTKDQISRLFAYYQSIERLIKIARELDFISLDRLKPLNNLCEILGRHEHVEHRSLANRIIGNFDGNTNEMPNYSRFLASDIAALAQHHGMATFLLDWTENPITACYFSSTKPPQINTPNGLAIWALNISTFPSGAWGHQSFGSGKIKQFPSVGIIRPASAKNKYLSSQSGVLTFVADFYDTLEKGRIFPDLETLLLKYDREDALRQYEAQAAEVGRSGDQNLIAEFNSNDMSNRKSIEDVLPENHTFLRKMILPENELLEYRKLLLREGISKAHLMPTLDNVAATARASLLG